MMRKELLVSGGMATILTVVTGVVIYFHGGDPTTDVPAADTTAADQPKVEPNVPGWPAGTAASNAPNPESKAAESKTAAASPAPRSPFPDVASSGGSPWNKPANDAKPPASDEPAKDVARPFGASEAADAASAFSSRFKSDVAAVEKKIDEALPATGPELKLPSENPLRNSAPSAATNMPPSAANSTPSTPAASPFSAPPASAEPQRPVAMAPVATGPAANASPFGAAPFGKSQPAPAASLATSPAASGATPAPPNLSSTTPPANVATQTPPMRAPTSEDLLWRPQGAANSPPRVTTDLTDNSLRSSASSSSTTVMPDAAKADGVPSPSSLAASNAPTTPTTLPTLPRRDAPAARAEPTHSQQPAAQTPSRPAETTAPRQPVQVASTIPVSTPPRTIPMQGGTRTQQLGRVYVVEDGDSLGEIARRELGNSARAGEIQALNREVLGGSAFPRPGLELILPR